MEVGFKKLSPKAITPSYATIGDAGLDMSAITYIINKEHNFIEYHTGLAFEIPRGYVGLLFPRSSVSKTDLRMANCVGVVDSGYRGEITFRYKFEKDSYFASLKRFQEGDRIGQLVVMPYPEIELKEKENLANSERGEGGYGSTGK
jgi:dUTP pyrophosphatase|tara:strand:- start:627 stop:1064 length:438 start_codon:yes stop_codon:yes gene_type:complete